MDILFKDDGKGISEENLPKVFDLFFTTQRDNGGTGLGLNIVYNIITSNLNGSIKCESTQNEGTVFNMSIPL
ncbi:MAG: HAMP domain-containing histidine kinase [Campylobacteraceae bacterium]|nr:HAMP domain-containing histidine kinase [Campylobacteraceae bacterium]